MEELQREIETARRKLNEAVEKGYNEETCYELSEELDKLIECYLDMEEKNDGLKEKSQEK